MICGRAISVPAHMQVSAHTVLHQRVFECLLSGGLALRRLQADDLCTMQFAAAAEACAAGEGACGCERSLAVAGLGISPRRVSDERARGGRGFNGMLRELGLGEQEFLWINQVMVERLRARGAWRRRSSCRRAAVGDPGAVMFHSARWVGIAADAGGGG